MSAYGWNLGPLGIYRGVRLDHAAEINAIRGVRTRLWGVTLGRFGILLAIRVSPARASERKETT